jgi:hypothetical protein
MLMIAVSMLVVGGRIRASEGSDPSAPIVYKPMVPRWQLPPIANPYFIGWYGAHTPSKPRFERALLLESQTMETLAPAEDLAWWYGRGIMGCPWAAGTQVEWLNTVDDFVAQFEKAIKARQVGVCLDELVGFDAETQRLRQKGQKRTTSGNPKNRRLAEACRIIKEKHPDFFIAVYSHMQSDSMVEAMKAGWIDLNIVMSYMHWPGEPAWTEELALWRLRNARKAGVMEKTIPCIGIWKAPNEVVTLEWIEKWIKYYREHFPQMPGVFFYPHPARGVGGRSAVVTPRQHQMVRHCDQLARKYYIDPAPKVSIVTPRDGAIVGCNLHVEASADKAVAKWRLYLGSQMVEENESGKFDITDVAPGTKILTVHAITGDWLRSATQIQVSVGEPENPATSSNATR